MAEEKNKTQEHVVPGTDITQEKLEEYKKEYKKIYLTQYMGETYVWHRLNRKTFGKICDETEQIEDADELMTAREIEITKACTIYPDAGRLEEILQEDDDNMVSQRIAREIMYRSGFYQPQTVEL